MNRKSNNKWAMLLAMLTIVTGFACTNQKKSDEQIAEQAVEEIEVSEDELEALALALPKYNQVESFHEGLAAVCDKETTLWGFIDKTGKQVIPKKFTAVGDFHDGLCCAFGEGKGGFIDKEGNWVITGDYQAISLYEYLEGSEPLCSTFSDGLAWMCNKEGKFGYIDREGNVVIPFRYEPGVEEIGEDEVCYSDQPVFDFHQGLARVWDKATGKFGYIDKEGNEVFPSQFDFAEDVSEGVAVVQKDDKFGFVTPKGESTFDF